MASSSSCFPASLKALQEKLARITISHVNWDEDLSPLPSWQLVTKWANNGGHQKWNERDHALYGCTFRHIAEYLDDQKCQHHQRPETITDWVTSEYALSEMKRQQISSREYARCLVRHKSILRAMVACMPSWWTDISLAEWEKAVAKMKMDDFLSKNKAKDESKGEAKDDVKVKPKINDLESFLASSSVSFNPPTPFYSCNVQINMYTLMALGLPEHITSHIFKKGLTWETIRFILNDPSVVKHFSNDALYKQVSDILLKHDGGIKKEDGEDKKEDGKDQKTTNHIKKEDEEEDHVDDKERGDDDEEVIGIHTKLSGKETPDMLLERLSDLHIWWASNDTNSDDFRDQARSYFGFPDPEMTISKHGLSKAGIACNNQLNILERMLKTNKLVDEYSADPLVIERVRKFKLVRKLANLAYSMQSSLVELRSYSLGGNKESRVGLTHHEEGEKGNREDDEEEEEEENVCGHDQKEDDRGKGSKTDSDEAVVKKEEKDGKDGK